MTALAKAGGRHAKGIHVAWKEVAVEELDDVVGMKTDVDGEARTALLRTMGEQYAVPAAAKDRSEWDAFEPAGWLFVRATPTTRAAIVAQTRVAGVQAAARVFRHPRAVSFSARIRLSVRLRDDLTDEQARVARDRAGLTIANRLKFAPQMYEVVVAPGRDFLQASIDLSANSDFQFAEPQLIEHIPGRFTPTDPDYHDQWHLNNTG